MPEPMRAWSTNQEAMAANCPTLRIDNFEPAIYRDRCRARRFSHAGYFPNLNQIDRIM